MSCEHCENAKERADKAEAEATAMHACLESIADGDGGCSSKYGPGCDGQCQWTARGGLDGTASRALAARVPLWRELERLARDQDRESAMEDVLRKLSALDKQGVGA